MAWSVSFASPVTPLISFVYLLCGIARPYFALFVVSLCKARPSKINNRCAARGHAWCIDQE